MRQLEQQVNTLTTAVTEQGRRIEALEKELRAKLSASEPDPPSTTPTRSVSLTRQLWHDKIAWGRVKNGMSEADVVSIFGSPASVEAVSPYKVLFYRGEVTGGVSIRGNVRLQYDRVLQVNAPIF